MNTPWSYIKLSQVMSSVKSDLNIFDDAGMIDEDRVSKIVSECNEKIGQRIFKSRECKILVKDGMAKIPDDFWKLENIFATCIIGIQDISPVITARQLEFSPTLPEDETKIITYGKMGCVDSCNNCYWVSDRRPEYTQNQIQYEAVFPLSLSNRVLNSCTEYSPCVYCNKGEYNVDIENNKFKFNFDSGEVYISYLGNLISEDGEIEIPFHPKLNPYYEYSIKEKILEDIFLNSESDVINKLKYISDKRKEAYAIAWDFANSAKVNEWSKAQKNIQMDYYNKWCRIFN